MVINFECQKCGPLFDCDVGTVTLSEISDKPDFEKEIIGRYGEKLELISLKEEPQGKRKKKRRGKKKKSRRKR